MPKMLIKLTKPSSHFAMGGIGSLLVGISTCLYGDFTGPEAGVGSTATVLCDDVLATTGT